MPDSAGLPILHIVRRRLVRRTAAVLVGRLAAPVVVDKRAVRIDSLTLLELEGLLEDAGLLIVLIIIAQPI